MDPILASKVLSTYLLPAWEARRLPCACRVKPTFAPCQASEGIHEEHSESYSFTASAQESSARHRNGQ